MRPAYEYQARIVGVYDGDTFYADIDLGFTTSKLKEILRLSRVDTPEVRGTEKAEGIKVREYVKALILDKEVILKTEQDKKGKYGRYLAEVFFEREGKWINLSDHLLEIGFAKLYQ